MSERAASPPRSAAEMDRWRDAIYETARAGPPPVGVRQVFYQLVMRHGLPKTEANY
jgi:hypothetical protein